MIGRSDNLIEAQTPSSNIHARTPRLALLGSRTYTTSRLPAAEPSNSSSMPESGWNGYNNTVRKLLRAQRAPAPSARVQASKLDPYKPYLIERWTAHALSAVRLWPEIRAQGFTGSTQIVRRFLHTLKAERHVDQSLTVRFETPPSEQAQCDWAEVGRYPQPDGTSIRIYAFVMVLGYSRYLYIEFTRSMTLATLIRCHQNAFAFFGGWTQRILYDNMRQVIVGPERTNARFLDFARHHGFEAKRCRPYRPRTKGKVERSVSYLRDSFLNGRTFTGLDDLNAQGRHWLGSVANIRIHATTQARNIQAISYRIRLNG